MALCVCSPPERPGWLHKWSFRWINGKKAQFIAALVTGLQIRLGILCHSSEEHVYGYLPEFIR